MYSIWVTILKKSSRRDKVIAHEVSIPCLRSLYSKIVSQNAPDCISAHIRRHGPGMPQDPLPPTSRAPYQKISENKSNDT